MSVEKFSYLFGSKKERHWSDIAEEEAMQQRIIQEAIQNQQATAVGNAAAAGAGGTPDYKFFNPNTSTSFTSNITTADAPFRVQFSNTSHYDICRYGFFSLAFGDGLTSSDPNSSYLYTSTGSFSASLTSTTTYGNVSTTSSPIIVSGSKPTVTAGFTFTTSSVSASATATFTNTSTNSSQVPTTIYRWEFGTGSLVSTATNPTQIYASSGGFTASLQVTGSFGLTSLATASFRLA